MSGKQLLTTSLVFILFYVTYQYVGYKFGLIKQVPIEKPEISEPVGTTDGEKDTTVPPELSPEPLSQVDSHETDDAAVAETDVPPTEAEEPGETVPEIEPQTIVLRNEVMEVIFDNRGGVIRKVTMHGFYESTKHLDKVVLVSPVKDAPGELIFDKLGSTADTLYNVDQPDEFRVVFNTVFHGVPIEKTYTLGDGYAIDFQLNTRCPDSDCYELVLAEGLEPMSVKDRQKKSLFSFLSARSSAPKMMEVAWSKDGSHKSKQSTKFESNQFEPVLDQDEILHWVGIKNTYFCNVFLPDEPLNNIQVKNNFKTMSSGKPQAVPVVGIRGGEQVVGTFYIGPLDKNSLQSVNSHLSNLVNYGYTGKLTEWMFIALEKIYSYVGNWGWAIVILTIFIRMIMFPLTAPSIKSGYKMRKIQPKLDAIKKKYSGKDMESKQKLSQETWKLYKQEKVNPFSSCITILPQMPIFIAYFSLLRTSISLRQSGWMFWINDLALKDPYFILPLIWGASMYLSQTMTPMPGDPSQQKMMKYMPVMMTLLFITMPSGLVLYMVTSNLFQLAQTVLFKWRYDKA